MNITLEDFLRGRTTLIDKIMKYADCPEKFGLLPLSSEGFPIGKHWYATLTDKKPRAYLDFRIHEPNNKQIDFSLRNFDRVAFPKVIGLKNRIMHYTFVEFDDNDNAQVNKNWTEGLYYLVARKNFTEINKEEITKFMEKVDKYSPNGLQHITCTFPIPSELNPHTSTPNISFIHNNQTNKILMED